MDERLRARAQAQREHAAELELHVLRLLSPLGGSERALDAGCGLGALALALAPHVAELVGVDDDAEAIAAAQRDAPGNVTFVVGDVTHLTFPAGQFDVAGCLGVLHRVRRPELVVSELARVVRPGGRILVADQIADADPLQALAHDRFERSRDPGHQRLLSDGDIRALLEANDLVVSVNETSLQRRDLERDLDLAGVEEGARAEIRRLAPASHYEIEVGWYVARTPGGSG
jgi:ubiquinone/menaquinone biosynthesis C-methylase UbiE